MIGDARDGDEAHDVLAAEEYAVGAGDPRLHREPPHDVLAAEEYAVGAGDPVLHHRGPVRLPEDPDPAEPPRDVLAAEEFPLPGHVADGRVAGGVGVPSLRFAVAVAGLSALLVIRRRRGR